MANPIKGKDLHRGFQRWGQLQGTSCPLGVDTIIGIDTQFGPGQLGFRLDDFPQSPTAVRVYIGTVGGGRGRLARLGIDFSCSPDSLFVTWLATAGYAILPGNVVTFVYVTKGVLT